MNEEKENLIEKQRSDSEPTSELVERRVETANGAEEDRQILSLTARVARLAEAEKKNFEILEHPRRDHRMSREKKKEILKNQKNFEDQISVAERASILQNQIPRCQNTQMKFLELSEISERRQFDEPKLPQKQNSNRFELSDWMEYRNSLERQRLALRIERNDDDR